MAKSKNTQEPTGKVIENSLEDILANRFARYSKYIIQERALPDARDGLKPVQRRILYAMLEAGNTWNKPYHKSAKTVGNVIGNYHPHGDYSVYDAMVRMSQDWKIRLPLIDMQGNNGSIDDDPAAAMRYTECRLSRIASYLLQDIDKKTVEWAPNFSDEKMEPTVLPAAYPNLLTHGISGIAAGYATNIPPHNLNEVIRAAIFRIEHPQCSVADLMQILPGPDFPTGGYILNKEGIRQAFETGKGKIYIRSKAEIADKKTIRQIRITEIPYEVVKSSLVRRIDDLRSNVSLSSILDVRDESDRNGLSIVIDLKKDAPAQEVLQYLYKNSDLQVSYSYNMIAIVNQTPVLLSIDKALDAFLQHRQEVISRRSAYDLANIENRLHILEGLIRAVSILDEIIALIRKSKDKQDSKNKIMEAFKFTAEQAEAIVSMRLYRLSNTDILSLQQEYKDLEKQAKKLRAILKSKARLQKEMIAELEQILQEFPQPRLSQILEEEASVQVNETAMIPDEQTNIAISYDGYVKRVSSRSMQASSAVLAATKESDHIIAQGSANSRDTLLIFTSQGRYGMIPVYSVPEAKWKDVGTHISSLLKTEQNEKICSAYVVKDFDQGVQMVAATKRGQIKRFWLKDLPLKSGRMSVCMKLASDDALLQVIPSSSSKDSIVVISHLGYGYQYPVRSIPLQGLKTRGSKGVNLTQEDYLAAAAVPANARQILLYQHPNAIKRMNLEEVPALSRPARGRLLVKAGKDQEIGLEGCIVCNADTSIPFAGLEHQKASILPLKKASGFFGQAETESLELIPPLALIEKGDWVQEEELQPRLFAL